MGEKSVPLLLELVPQLKHLDLDLTLALVLEQALVRLALPMLQAVEVARLVGRAHVARPHVRQVALHVPRRAAAARGREADVV